ncbi:hypothetical protein CRG98_034043 [Punica granatum]|uniref:Uncharacterized protein n=1 Tax=Punica granatum TaxID=22663 RepID=A0A2I0INE3_PUNGR|nr:hypothetical protein CRG98_034043 [Punica granatum]
MLQYWDYEEFVIHTFQDSLARAALDCKFIDQYKYCARVQPGTRDPFRPQIRPNSPVLPAQRALPRSNSRAFGPTHAGGPDLRMLGPTHRPSTPLQSVRTV